MRLFKKQQDYRFSFFGFLMIMVILLGCNNPQTESISYKSELKQIEKSLFIQGNWKDAIAISKIELQRPNLSDEDNLYYLLALGKSYRFSENYNFAERNFNKLIKDPSAHKYPNILGEAFYGLGDLNYLKWSYFKEKHALDKAKTLLDSSMYYAKLSKNVPLESKNLYRTGTILQIQGKNDSSMTNFKKGLELSFSVSDTAGIIRNDIHKASEFETKGVLDSALFHYDRAYQLAKIQNKNYTEAHSLCNLGLFYLDRNEVEIAREYFIQAKFISEELNHRIILCRSYYGLGLIEEKLGNKKDVLKFANLGLSLAREKGYKNYILAFKKLIEK